MQYPSGNGPRINCEVWQDEYAVIKELATRAHMTVAGFTKMMMRLGVNEATKVRNS